VNFLLKFILGGDSKPLEDAGEKGKKTLKDLKSEYRDNLNEAAKWTVGIAAAGAALTVHMINKARHAIDEQYALARSFRQTMATMATLEHAADLVGISYDKLTASSKILDQNIGKAAQGIDAQSKLFERLRLSAQDLADLPLDQRIVKINEAIRENIPLVEQAAIAAEIFGAKNGAAIMLLDGKAISQAAEEVKVLGQELDSVDAAKIDAANDSFGRITKGAEGFWKQLAVQVAPILDAVGQKFYDNTKAAGGMETKAMEAFEAIVTGAGFAMDMVRGLHVVAQGVVVAFAAVGASVINMIGMIIEGWTELANLIPGIDVDYDQTFFGKLEERVNTSLTKAVEDLQELAAKPMPSTGFKQWVEEVKAAAQAAAEEVARVQDAINTGEGSEGGTPAEDPETARFKEQLATKLEALRESLLSEKELEREHYRDKKDILDQALANELVTEEEYDRQLEALAMQTQSNLTEIERNAAEARKRISESEKKAKMAMAQSTLSDLSTLMNTESRKLFEIGKAAAIANAIIDTHAGMTKALAQGGFWGIAMAAAVAAKGFASVSAIRSQQFGGGGSGAQATGSNTAAVNAASTPVASGATSGSGQTTIIQLQGENFSRSAVRALVEQLNESNRDGGRIILGN
jgi:hypothetical protein